MLIPFQDKQTLLVMFLDTAKVQRVARQQIKNEQGRTIDLNLYLLPYPHGSGMRYVFHSTANDKASELNEDAACEFYVVHRPMTMFPGKPGLLPAAEAEGLSWTDHFDAMISRRTVPK